MDTIIQVNGYILALFGVGLFGGMVKLFRSTKKLLESQNKRRIAQEEAHIKKVLEEALTGQASLFSEALVAILHNKIYTQGACYIQRGYVTIDELHDLEHLYDPYRAMGGNGTAEQIYNNVKNLPVKQKSVLEGK